MTRSRAVRPWVRAFWDERAWPSGVRGPVLCCALAALAARRSGEVDIFLIPRLDVKGWEDRAEVRVLVSYGGLGTLSCACAVTVKIREETVRLIVVGEHVCSLRFLVVLLNSGILVMSGPMKLIRVRFPDQESKRRGLGFLAGRFSFTS